MFSWKIFLSIARGMLSAVVLAFPFVVVQAQTGPASWQGDWERVLAAAKKEGKVAIIGPAGDVYRNIWDTFQKKYGITVDLFAVLSPSDLVPRIDAERKSGRFLLDAVSHGPGPLLMQFKPKGWLDPLRPAFILPEVYDDNKWVGGFTAGFIDREKSHVYVFVSHIDSNVHVNRNVIPESQLNKFDQLWDPKWAGKIVMFDPLLPGPGEQIAATWLVAKGEDKLRAFIRNQQLVFSRDRRQIGEWVVRGRYPIAVGLVPSILTVFVEQGLSIEHVKPLSDDDPATTRLTYSGGGLGLVNRAPHPNAAKVFINWLLSQEGQTTYAQRAGYNVRRTDVAVVNPANAVDPSKKYLDVTREETYAMRPRAVKIVQEAVR